MCTDRSSHTQEYLAGLGAICPALLMQAAAAAAGGTVAAVVPAIAAGGQHLTISCCLY